MSILLIGGATAVIEDDVAAIDADGGGKIMASWLQSSSR